MRITHSVFLLLSILFISNIVFIHNAEAETITTIYESDFSSDPQWETDQPENFYWQASTSALYAHIENTPPEYKPNRYYIQETSLDPTQSFQLSVDMKMLDFDVNGAALFGLYASDYESLNQNRVTGLVSNGTVNIKPMSFNGNTGYWDFYIVDEDHDRHGVGGLGSPFVLNKWYEIVIDYEATSGTVHMTMTNKDTGEVWRDVTREDVFFSEDLRYLGISMHPDGEPKTTMSHPSRLTGSSDFLIDNVLLTQSVPDPEIDPLILEYAPILYMHEDEDYFPMNVEAFVEGSSLWDEGGTQLFDADSLDFSTFESFVEENDTENTYLAFSNPDIQRSIDLASSKQKYDDLVTSNVATTTVYYHKMNDTTDDGREFIVLQYWFFYAMNNWAEHGGRNNHEGDWESVFVFLNADTEEPEYVAYSAHLNDGFELDDIKQYSSVRREWRGDIEKNGTHVNSYVALGSHANYPKTGNHPVVPLIYYDETSLSGQNINADNLLNIISTNWHNYQGFWGTQINELGSDGPLGPKYIELTSQNRFNEPLEWAGIEKGVIETTVLAATDSIEYVEQKIKFVFGSLLEVGTGIGVSLHEEYISFGENIEEIQLLPNFWDISSSLENETFNAQVSFSYEQNLVEELEINEDQLTVFYFNPGTEIWEQQIAEVDVEENQVTFETTHFSRYALGVATEEPEEELSLDELFDQLTEAVGGSDLRKVHKKVILGQIRLAEGFVDKNAKVAKIMFKNIEKKIQLFEKLGKISEGRSEEVLEILGKILGEV